MSVENARACFEKIITDEAFRNQLDSVETPEKRQQIIIEAGYEFTDEEWNEMVEQNHNALSNQELNEEELESVVGGAFFPGITMAAYGGSPLHNTWWRRSTK